MLLAPGRMAEKAGRKAASVLPDAVAAEMMTSLSFARTAGRLCSCMGRSLAQPFWLTQLRTPSESNKKGDCTDCSSIAASSLLFTKKDQPVSG